MTNRRYFACLALSLSMLFTAFASGAVSAAPQPPTPKTIAPSPSASPAAGTTVDVPGGTTVVVGLTEPVSSATANENDQIALVVKRDVVVNGTTVIAAGANGHATVTSVTHAAGNGSGGKIAMSVDWVYSVDGGKIALSQTNHASENGDNKGAASTATLLSWALLGPLGFFAHNFVRGHDVTIGTDKSFTVFIDHDVHVQTSPKAAPGFDH